MPLLPPVSAPPGRMTGPPPAPPDTPTLSAYREGGDPDKAHAGALPKLFFNAEQALEDIAAAVPKFADELDQLKDNLRDLLSKVMSEGVQRMTQDEDGLPSYR